MSYIISREIAARANIGRDGALLKIGFIALAVMGAPMARHLAAARHDIATLFNKSSLPGGHHLTAEAK